jgi:hypothetical protein
MTYRTSSERPLHTVAFTQTFLAHAKAEGMTQQEIDALSLVLGRILRRAS